MSFFDSELVRAEMVEISELQGEVYKNVFDFYKLEKHDKIYHINLLQRLLDKQQILYTRLSLSDDPDAVEMKYKISQSAVLMGLPEDTNMNIVFNSMSNLIDLMRDNIDT
jgi:hypothetical protein